MSRRPSKVTHAALLMLGLAACSDGTGPGNPGAAALTRAEADTAAAVLLADLESTGEGITATGLLGLVGIGVATEGPGSLAAAVDPASASAAVQQLASFGRRWDICTPAPEKTVATAGGITTVTWVFSNCVVTAPPGARLESIRRDGTVRIARGISDGQFTRSITFGGREGGAPIPADVPGFTRSWTRTPLARPGQPAPVPITTAENRNGTRRITGSSSALTVATTGGRTLYTHPDGSTSRHTREWTKTFTADVAGSIANDQPLPAGTWTFGDENLSTWERRGIARTLSTTTPTVDGAAGVHYDPACTEAPQFDRGVLRTVVTRTVDGTTRRSVVTVTFTGCGAYTVTTE